MRRLWLIGMPGAGKSTTGALLAARLGVPFTDTDLVVEEMTGQKVPDLWEAGGEEAFRDAESLAIESLARVEGVIATGGGSVLVDRNRDLMTGAVIWLDAGVDTLARRLESEPGRPVLAGSLRDRLAETMAARKGLYLELADHRLEVDGLGPEEVVDRVVMLWRV